MGQKQMKFNRLDQKEIVVKMPQEVVLVRTTKKSKAAEKGLLPFDKNEMLLIIMKVNDFWVLAMKLVDKQQGFVPTTSVMEYNAGPMSLEAFKNIGRDEAEELLMNPTLNRGTYIVRPSSRPHCYALSLRDIHHTKGCFVVTHFLINSIPNEYGQKYCSSARLYPDIATLIKNFEKNGLGKSRTKLTGRIPDTIDSMFQRQIKKIIVYNERNTGETHQSAKSGCISISKLRLKREIRNVLNFFACIS